ncbi:hypothetical protein MTO96_050562, partial [Rhipicephalus appendiculatus]
MKKIWLDRINRKGHGGKYALWKPKPSNRVCGIHFNISGRRAYEDTVPRFFPAKTYPPWTRQPSCSAKRQKRQSEPANAQVCGELPARPVFLTEMDVSSVVTVSSPGLAAPAVVTREPRSAKTEHIDHPYSIGEASPRKAVSHQKHVVAVLEESSSRLQIFAWSPQQFKSQFLSIVPAFISAKSVVEVFHSLVDLPSLTAALLHEREMMGVPEGARAKRQSSVHIGSEVHKSMLKFVLRDISGIGDTFDGVAKFHSLIADQVNHPKVIRCSEHAPDLLG